MSRRVSLPDRAFRRPDVHLRTPANWACKPKTRGPANAQLRLIRTGASGVINKRITIIFLATLAAIFVALSFMLFRPFIYPLIAALVIGIVFAPVHARIERRVR